MIYVCDSVDKIITNKILAEIFICKNIKSSSLNVNQENPNINSLAKEISYSFNKD